MDKNLKIKNILRLLIGYGRVSTTDDSQAIQSLNCELLEGGRTIPRLQNYGLATNPPSDSLVLAVCSGQRKDLIGICVQAKDRPKGLQPGETVLHNDKIELRLNGDKASFNTRKVEISGVDILKTLEEIVDFLLKQPPVLPLPEHLKNIQGLTALKVKIGANLGS